MKPIKVNGVVVCCSNCINHQVSPLDEPCKDCWKAIFHSGNIDEVRLDDIVFYPADKERFLTLEKMVKKYKDQFAAMKADAKAHGISIEELCKQFANRRTDDDEFDADTTEFDKLFESFSREAIS